MNICFTNPTKKLRGGIKGLSKFLVSKGHKVTILTPRSLTKEELAYIDSVQVMVYPSIILPKIRYTIPLFFSQFRILRKVIKEEKITIIHVWEYFYPVAWIPLFYAKICDIPIVLTTDTFPGISWRYGSKFVDLVAKAYSKSIGIIILRYADKITLLGTNLVKVAQEIRQKEGGLSVIPNGVDLTCFSLKSNTTGVKKDLGIGENEAMMLNISRLTPVKGIDTLIKITERLLKDGVKVKTVIVGNDPYKGEYQKLAQATGVSENIIFTGFRKDIPELMSACDIFVLPSLSEGLPAVLLEASACGKPIIASNVGGIPDIVIHGETGFLAEPKDIDSFTHYVKLLLNDEDLSRNLGRNAYEHVKRNFDWDMIIKKYEEIYEQMMKAKR